MKQIPFPRYKREDKLNAKLSLKDIEEIKKLYATGKHTQSSLGVRFGVATRTIGRAMMSEEEKKLYNKERYVREGSSRERYGVERTAKIAKRVKERKKRLFKEEVQEYYREKAKSYRRR